MTDIQYLLGYTDHGCSGYRPKMQNTLYDVFSKNAQLFQLAYQIEDTLWTHAGVHEGWFRYRFKRFMDGHPELTLAEQLNLAFEEYHNPVFDIGYRRGGYYDVGGPLWCDMAELKSSPLRGYNQIVGHTKTQYIQRMNLYNKEVTFIDVLQNKDVIDTSLFYYKEIL